jgi:hypothetical protein
MLYSMYGRVHIIISSTSTFIFMYVIEAAVEEGLLCSYTISSAFEIKASVP